MNWLVWMFAGIGAFWSLLAVIMLPLFIAGGMITLKKERMEIREATGKHGKDGLSSVTEEESLNEKSNPLDSEQAGVNVLDGSTIRE